MAAFALTCLSACSSDSVSTPVTPTAYRLTLHTTDPSHPTRTISATIDWRQDLFVSGMNGKDASVPMVKSGETWAVPSSQLPNFPFTLSQPFQTDHFPIVDDLIVQALSLRPSDGGCIGTISASLAINHSGGDVVSGYEVSSTFDCVEDHVGPLFTAGNEAWPINPVDLGCIGADEDVAPSVVASLNDAAGTTIALTPTASTGSASGSSRLSVSAALAFGSTYNLVVSGADLAGNTATSSTQITTDPDPGLLSQDGFEGPINAGMTGMVKVVEEPAMPIPTGKKALAFTKMWSGTLYDRFTARLQAPAGATAVKVTYVRVRGKAPDATSPAVTYSESHIVWTVGIPNTTAIAVYDKDQPPVTATPRPWTIDPAAQGATGWYSDPQTLTFPLPAPAVGGEVLFDVLTDQFPASGDGAFILDDLRVE